VSRRRWEGLESLLPGGCRRDDPLLGSVLSSQPSGGLQSPVTVIVVAFPSFRGTCRPRFSTGCHEGTAARLVDDPCPHGKHRGARVVDDPRPHGKHRGARVVSCCRARSRGAPLPIGFATQVRFFADRGPRSECPVCVENCRQIRLGGSSSGGCPSHLRCRCRRVHVELYRQEGRFLEEEGVLGGEECQVPEGAAMEVHVPSTGRARDPCRIVRPRHLCLR